MVADAGINGLVVRVRTDWRWAALVAAALALAYVVLGRLTFAVSVEHGNVTSVVFAPEGVALACCVLFGRRVAPGVLLGQAVLSFWSGPSVLGGIAIGVVNTFEGVLGSVLFDRWRIDPRLRRPGDVAALVALIALVLQPISATGGVAVLWAIGTIPDDFVPAGWAPWIIQGIQKPIPSLDLVPRAWVHWWVGNSVGQILVAPLLLAWVGSRPTRQTGGRHDLAVSAVGVSVVAVAAVTLPVHPLVLLAVTYPLLVWIGLRRGLRGVTAANVLITPAVIWAGASGRGFLSHLSVADRLTYVGFFVATGCVFSLMLFAMFEERRELVDRLTVLASTDPLVPLANRRRFVERLGEELTAAAQHGDELAVAIVDVDHFKRINDRFGHAVGDRVLVAVAAECAAQLRESDLGARIGGEEFAVLLPRTGPEAAIAVAERLRAAVAALRFDLADGTDEPGAARVTVSVGLTSLGAGDTLDSLLVRADGALYEAKGGGRDRVVVAAALAGIAAEAGAQK